MTARGLSYVRAALRTGLGGRLQVKACAPASCRRKSSHTVRNADTTFWSRATSASRRHPSLTSLLWSPPPQNRLCSVWTHQMIPPPAQYGGRHTVTLIPGDGIGPELLNHVRELFRFCCVPVDFEVVNVDSSAASEDDINNAIMAIRRNGVALKGNLETNHNLPPSYKSRNNLLRTTLDLYANVMHCKSLPGVPSRHHDVDIVIIRENTEGEYTSLEHENVPGVVECLKIITRSKSLRIADYAFRTAREKGRRRVTAVHKANIMKLADGLFLECCREVAGGFPEIAFDSMIVDNTTMQLVSRPQQFDVMVMPNLYGNVVSNICAALVGGPGLVPGANYGRDYAVFETLHTQDLGGQGSTSEVVHFIMEAIQRTGPLTVRV
ncbi:isocitrate dehydrogenase [NAD] subunit gamma, mitochondrial-like isoform X2 [Syngnathoides biaculeatus]|uniref:isocitrate dehydrogenase [NAD] subunit gamma, mitochondrial-like isoform X2 n=1 Tax=Syngnathoides biaculeatus TaxID=300417 RepID=UPI002ADD3B99|nr:isocitrate dehydrogenase [NAD] subunit gamma, mitochondrial-like isoform X2 [Syngnathoides biaculeatus]